MWVTLNHKDQSCSLRLFCYFRLLAPLHRDKSMDVRLDEWRLILSNARTEVREDVIWTCVRKDTHSARKLGEELKWIKTRGKISKTQNAANVPPYLFSQKLSINSKKISKRYKYLLSWRYLWKLLSDLGAKDQIAEGGSTPQNVSPL